MVLIPLAYRMLQNVCARALAVAAECRLSIINWPHAIGVRLIRRFAKRFGHGVIATHSIGCSGGPDFEASAAVASCIATRDSGFDFVREISGTR